jgi:hypothetical protein
VGYNNKSKGYRVYWPFRRHISIERDVYFNKNEALLPDTAQIEGETATRANSGGFTTSFPPKPVKTVTDSNSGAKDLLNAPLKAQIERKLTEIEPNNLTPQKHLKNNQNHHTFLFLLRNPLTTSQKMLKTPS